MNNGQNLDRRGRGSLPFGASERPRQVRIPAQAGPRVGEPALASVLGQFGTGPPTAVARVAEGLLNIGFRVTAPSGTYFLKCYIDRATAGHDAIAAQHRATTALHALGLPAIPPLPARDGRTIIPWGGRRYALYPWIEGVHRHGRDLTHRQSGELGALLAHLHLGLAEVQPPVLQPPDGRHAADPVLTAALLDDLLVQAERRSARDPFDALAARRLRERRTLLNEHAHRRSGPHDAPPTGWVHGDFHPLNLLYARGGPAAVLDWDRLGLLPRAEEAVRGATLFFQHRETGVLDLSRVRYFARAYRGAEAATTGELGAAVHRVWWERLNDFWTLEWRYRRGDQRADPLFPALAAQVRWWCDEYEQVLDAFTN